VYAKRMVEDSIGKHMVKRIKSGEGEGVFVQGKKIEYEMKVVKQ
jgi:hypothetical protein